MANMFALILVIATLVTGILWCVDKFFFAPKRRERQAAAQAAAGDSLDKATLKKVAPKPGWLETGASVFPVLAIVLIVRSFIYEPFQIPSGSMMPTLLIGDFILVEKFAYGIKDPIYQKTLIETGHPKRGDIVVFKYPEDQKLDYIKRAVGLPGDKVTYDPVSKELTIQPGCSSGQACENALPVTYSNVEPSDFVQTFSRRNGGEATSGFFEVPKNETKENGIRLSERKETLGDVTHRILTVPIAQDLLASKLGNSEALVVKKTISKPEDLIGKRIAVPFISTTHYSLLAALKHWGIKPGQVEIVNLQPPAI
ncbi:signal peptidase I, partial [Escherichia coli]|uniref:signal peptidase I n=1 Tax=Escherichia coli TaxID=562 RepID=UPI00049FF0B2